MIRVAVGLYPSGCLRSLSAEGHAGKGTRGSDPVCAAVSVLLRTAFNMFERERGIALTGSVPAEGSAALEITRCDAEAEERLLGATTFLLTGMCDLAAEHPDHVAIVFEDKPTED